MQFITSRSEALDKLNQYIEKNISNYNAKRNFDFGVNNRSNVSCLSPYITHRLITEYETAKIVLKNGDTLSAVSNTASSVDIVTSYIDTISS